MVFTPPGCPPRLGENFTRIEETPTDTLIPVSTQDRTMARNSRRRFLKGVGVAAGVGLAGCSGGGDGGDGGSDGSGDGGDGGSDGGDGGSDGGSTTQGSSLSAVTIAEPEGTIHYPILEAAMANGIFEEQGIDLTVEYLPFPAQVQSITGGEIDTAMVSVLPYLSNVNKGEDLVTYGFDGCLQSINALYVLASSDYETIQDLQGQRIGVWSFGSSTVQAFQAVVAEETGLDLRQDFETTTAPPPALVGLLQDGEIDGAIDVSGLTITMESQPDTFRNVRQLNQMWLDRAGHTLPLTSWWSYSDWYEQNTDAAAGLVAGANEAAKYWRENTASILEEYGEPASIDTQAKIDVCVEWAGEGQIFSADTDQDFVDATWDFVNLMNDHGFLDEVPEQSAVIRNPMG